MSDPVTFAKPAFDVGLFSNDIEPLIRFYRDELGLHYDELLKVGGGIHQHRFSWGHSILKLNSVRERLPEAAPGPIEELRILRPGRARDETLRDPAGNRVRLCATAPDGQPALGATLAGEHVDRAVDGYTNVLGLAAVGETELGCGASRLVVRAGAANPPTPMRAPGLRYLTLQVTDVARAHRRAIDSGFAELEAPRTLGSVASISFVSDPLGTPIELSQRASLTGDLTIHSD